MDKGFMNDYLDNLLAGLTGDRKEGKPFEGAVQRIQNLGYNIGVAHPFVVYGERLEVAKPLLLIAGTALIALTIAMFVPALAAASFVVSAVGVLGLYVLSSSIALQAMAFGVGVCAPTLAVILASRYLRARQGTERSFDWLRSIIVFAAATGLSLVGVMYIVALLSGITYYLVLEQYRGVALLHLLPIVLVAIYALVFADSLQPNDVLARLKRILLAKITVLWVVLAAAAIGFVYYYLTRTGNAGQASQLEKMIRSFLENGIGVRPRFKEFLFAHPLFILAAYLYVKHKHAIYLFAGAVMGQLSIIDTFAHLHTPLYISAIRVGLGIAFGVVISLVYIGVWKQLARGWLRWR